MPPPAKWMKATTYRRNNSTYYSASSISYVLLVFMQLTHDQFAMAKFLFNYSCQSEL